MESKTGFKAFKSRENFQPEHMYYLQYNLFHFVNTYLLDNNLFNR